MKHTSLRKKLLAILMSIALVLSFSVISALPAQAATSEDIQASIDEGIAWIVTQQWPDGSFQGGELAQTSFAVLKLLDRAYETGKDPFQTNPAAADYYMYHENVVKAFDYIFLHASTYGVGKGITFTAGTHETYNTGIAMMAISASKANDRVVTVGPFAGLTYQQVVQGCVDYLAFAQLNDGAWRYWYLDSASDNSNTGYVALGLLYAEEFGCDISGIAVDDPDGAGPMQGLSQWLDFIQDDVNGGSWYTAGTAWVNLYKTGNLLVEFALVGDSVGITRVDNAIDYIENNWNTPLDDWGYPQWQGNYLSMYSLMKGFQVQGIEEIQVGATSVDWFDEIADYLLANQLANGSWPGDFWCNSMLTTELALLTLEKVAPPPIANNYITATPETAENPVMTSHEFTATVWVDKVDPEVDVPVTTGVAVGFEVISGPNAGEKGSNITASNGEADFAYIGDGGGGTDTIRVWIDKNENGEWNEDEDYCEITKDWLVEYITGGGNIKNGKGKPIWNFAGNVGFLDDGKLTIKGQFQIKDFATNTTWHCHNDFSSLVFSGTPATDPTASHNTATFTGTFTNNKGDEKVLTIVIVDKLEAGKKLDGDTINTSGDLIFSADPISSGNFQVHDGYKAVLPVQ